MNPNYVGIAATNLDTLQDCTAISEVTTINDPRYDQKAFVPCATLRPPSKTELRSFLASDETPDTGCIELINFTPRLRTYIIDHPDAALTPTDCQPNQRTTTCYGADDPLRPGLHVDSQQNLPLSQRTGSNRRIGLNFGPGSRYLLLGSVDIFSIGEALDLGPEDRPSTLDARKYARLQEEKAFEPLRCLWLLIKPGQAYIAPTENIVHDGSTHTIDQPSRIGFWVGAWTRSHFGSRL